MSLEYRCVGSRDAVTWLLNIGLLQKVTSVKMPPSRRYSVAFLHYRRESERISCLPMTRWARATSDGSNKIAQPCREPPSGDITPGTRLLHRFECDQSRCHQSTNRPLGIHEIATQTVPRLQDQARQVRGSFLPGCNVQARGLPTPNPRDPE